MGGIFEHRDRLLVFCLLCCLVCAAGAEPLAIRVHASEPGAVYIRTVGEEERYRLHSERLPATVEVEPGQRVDIRVLGLRNWWSDWFGELQGRTGPASVTVRLEPKPAWGRIATAVCLLFGLVSWAWWRSRRASHWALERAQSEIAELNHRVERAESVGATPTRLGRFRILGTLGKGGMGTVYLGEDEQGWTYALKVPHQMDERAVREAELAAAIRSPHVVRYFGMERCPNGVSPPHLVMEYLKGETLHERLGKRGRFELKALDRLCQQLLKGLEAAHEAGVYHRDLKPQNVFLAGQEGRETLKITDFGLATDRSLDGLTRKGDMLGTPSYAAPEQMRGDPVDQRTDLYATGVILYEMATGLLPWNCTEPLMLLRQKLEVPPRPPQSYRADLPLGWSTTILRLLCPGADQRPLSSREVEALWRAEGVGCRS